MPEWKNTDPRIDIYKRRNIIVLYPSLEGRGIMLSTTAHVETKYEYCVFFWQWAERRLLKEEEQWDPAWLWIYAPEPVPSPDGS